jgi:hypothetical protein
MRTGRLRTVEDEEAVAELITKTLARKPKAATHWSVRAIAKEIGIAKSTVHRPFQLFGLQPHRTRGFSVTNYVGRFDPAMREPRPTGWLHTPAQVGGVHPSVVAINVHRI